MDTLFSQRQGDAPGPDGQLERLPGTCLSCQEGHCYGLVSTKTIHVIRRGNVGAKAVCGIKAFHDVKLRE